MLSISPRAVCSRAGSPAVRATSHSSNQMHSATLSTQLRDYARPPREVVLAHWATMGLTPDFWKL